MTKKADAEEQFANWASLSEEDRQEAMKEHPIYKESERAHKEAKKLAKEQDKEQEEAAEAAAQDDTPEPIRPAAEGKNAAAVTGGVGSGADTVEAPQPSSNDEDGAQQQGAEAAKDSAEDSDSKASSSRKSSKK